MLTTFLFAIIPTILGIISTYVAWKWNPRQKLYDEADSIFRQWEALLVIRDKALQDNNSDDLTVVIAQLNTLRARKKIVMQRLGIMK